MSAAIATPGIGHNNPPSAVDILADKHAVLLREVEALAARANAAPLSIRNDGDLGTVADIVRTSRTLAKSLDTARVAEKEPHLTAGREIDGFFKATTERLDRVTKALEARATEYQRAKAAEERRRREEEARRAREEEERQRQIAARATEEGRRAAAAKAADKADEAADRTRAAEAAAQASAVDLTRVRTETGTVVTTRTTWEFEVTDLAAVPLEIIRPYLPRADVEKAIRTFVRMGGRQLAGVRIFESESAAFR
jgi:hypothetical protein